MCHYFRCPYKQLFVDACSTDVTGTSLYC